MSEDSNRRKSSSKAGKGEEVTGSDLLNEGKSILGDTLKKVFATGVSAAFMTEENIRSYLGELKLPKEIIGMVLQSANKSKDEITQRVSKEVVNIFQKIDWVKEIARFAETHKFKVSAEIEILKKNQPQDQVVE